MTGFALKFIDGTPVPDDYAAKLAIFTRSILDCNITEDDELTMGTYWLPPSPPTPGSKHRESRRTGYQAHTRHRPAPAA